MTIYFPFYSNSFIINNIITIVFKVYLKKSNFEIKKSIICVKN